MSKEILVNIGANGEASGLHFDEFPLTKLGRAEIRRATEIRFDEKGQYFWVEMPESTFDIVEAIKEGSMDAKILAAMMVETFSNFKTYAEARDFEVMCMQTYMTHSVLDSHGERLYLALKVRRAFNLGQREALRP